MEAVLDAPIEHALAMAVEFDLVKTWNRYVRNSVILHAKCVLHANSRIFSTCLHVHYNLFYLVVYPRRVTSNAHNKLEAEVSGCAAGSAGSLF